MAMGKVVPDASVIENRFRQNNYDEQILDSGQERELDVKAYFDLFHPT